MTVQIAYAQLKQALNLLCPPPESDWQKIKDTFRFVELDKHQYFLRIGEIAEQQAFVVSGLLRMYYVNSEGKEVNRGFAMQDTFCGAYPIANQTSPISIQALEPCLLLVGSLNKLKNSAYFDRLEPVILRQMLGFRERREQLMLLESAQARFEAFIADKPILKDRLPQGQIASYLGIAPATFSRLKKKMDLT